MSIQNILITGGSGFIGSKLTKLLLSKGYSVAWVSRKNMHVNGIKIFKWDTQTEVMDDAAIQWADAIIHLAGENISSRRWTKKRKQQIIQSRVNSTHLLFKYLHTSQKKMKLILAASGIGYYGNGAEIFTEETMHGSGFLSEASIAWETATKKLAEHTERFVTYRIGIVLDETGGAMKELTQTFTYGLAPVFGNGGQIYSWIMLDDVCDMMLFAIESNTLQGTFNCVAPHPVSQKTLMKCLRKKQQRKTIVLPVPVFVLKLILGEMSDAVLMSQQVSCRKILDAGYTFLFEDICK